MNRRKFIKSTAIAATATVAASVLPTQSSAEIPVGAIGMDTAGGKFRIFSDNGWIEPNGQLLSRKDYPGLYDAIKNMFDSRYGPDDDEFRIPNLREKVIQL